jgi:hypothetical protein
MKSQARQFPIPPSNNQELTLDSEKMAVAVSVTAPQRSGDGA